MPAKQGDLVKVEYEGRLEDGTVFDSSKKHDQPLQFKIGEKQVIKGFEDAIIGMEPGEEKEVTLPPAQAYGERNEELVKTIPRDKFPEEAKEGMMIGVPLEDGRQIPAKITKMDDKEVVLDLNFPLAGKTLIFKLKLLELGE